MITHIAAGEELIGMREKMLINYLDTDRERVMAGLRGAQTPEKAQEILERETDRLLLQYNEECGSARVRDEASGMLQALRSSVPLLDSVGEAQEWSLVEDEGARRSGGLSGISRALLCAGAALAAASLFLSGIMGGGAAPAGVLRSVLLLAAGGGCLFFAGRMSGTEVGIGVQSPERRIEIRIDPEKLWRSLRGAVMVIDRNLELVREREEADRLAVLSAADGGGKGAGGIGAAEIELFSGLLELADADSPQMAADIRYYLHRKGIEAVSFTEQDAAWFELLPSGGIPGEPVTVRPALVRDGRLLKKGMAVR